MIRAWLSPLRGTSTSACVRSLGDELGGDEPVIDEDVARADELEPSHRDQTGVAGPGADEVDAHPSSSRTSAGEVVAGGPRRSGDAPSPRAAARGGARPARACSGLHELCDVVAQPLCECRRSTAGRDRDRDRVLPVHGGEDEGAELRYVDDVAEKPAGLGVGGRRAGSAPCRRWRRRRDNARPGPTCGSAVGRAAPASAASSGTTSGATTVTSAPQSRRPETFSSATRPAAHDENAAAVQVDAGDIVALLGHVTRRPRPATRRCGRAEPSARRRPRRARAGTSPARRPSMRSDSSERSPSSAERRRHRACALDETRAAREACGRAEARPARRRDRRALELFRSGAPSSSTRLEPLRPHLPRACPARCDAASAASRSR